MNGFICDVGCQKVVFQSIGDLLRELQDYLTYPDAVEKRYLKDAVNKMDMPLAVENSVCDQETNRRECDPLINSGNSERIAPRR